jgi:hypothetical protein
MAHVMDENAHEQSADSEVTSQATTAAVDASAPPADPATGPGDPASPPVAEPVAEAPPGPEANGASASVAEAPAADTPTVNAPAAEEPPAVAEAPAAEETPVAQDATSPADPGSTPEPASADATTSPESTPADGEAATPVTASAEHPVPHPPAGHAGIVPTETASTSPGPEWDFGRVAEDGTVYLRTADGERAVGQWHAGTANEGLAFYQLRYDDLAAEVGLLENRLANGKGDSKAIKSSATHLTETLSTATVIGDIEALRARLKAVLDGANERIAGERAKRNARAEAAVAAKTALAEEAEKLAVSNEWKLAGDRFRTLVDEWRTITGVERKADQALWTRVSAARSEFGRRRGAHFATLDAERKVVQERKEALCKEAEKLASSTDWATTAAKYRDLMTEWKAAGRTAKSTDDALWARFRGAQDAFFAKRKEDNDKRDSEFLDNQRNKEKLLVEAEALDPGSPGAAKKLRDLQQRYDDAGKVPRNSIQTLERRMTAVEQKFKSTQQTKVHRGPDPSTSPLVIRLRESMTKLEKRVARAKAEGRDADAAEAESQLETQRTWLAQAERSR